MGEHVLGLPPIGEDTVEHLSDYPGLTLRHGSSLFLMSSVGQFFNTSNEFKSIDPTTDWEKWSSRTSDFSLYYSAVLDEATGQVLMSFSVPISRSRQFSVLSLLVSTLLSPFHYTSLLQCFYCFVSHPSCHPLRVCPSHTHTLFFISRPPREKIASHIPICGAALCN
jgi:hypothetical protein